MSKSRKNAFANRRISDPRISRAKRKAKASHNKVQRFSAKLNGFQNETKEVKARKGSRSVEEINLDVIGLKGKLAIAENEYFRQLKTYEAFLKKNRDLDKKRS